MGKKKNYFIFLIHVTCIERKSCAKKEVYTIPLIITAL